LGLFYIASFYTNYLIMARSNRSIPEINAGSMADIAFLLLIFFLVTTTMDVDTGIARKLPVLDEEQEIEDMQGNDRNIYEVYVNNKDALLVEEQEMDIDNLREGAKEFLNNNGRDPKLSDNPEKAIISLQNSRGTSYEMYIAVQNELTAAYNELRDEAALRKYSLNYSELAKDKKKEIRKMYPMKISEAEPFKQ
jgi:biopolymer transport protein ExbD